MWSSRKTEHARTEETASVVCDEGDVVLECVEKDEQRHDKVDDDCDYDEAGLGIHGREGAGKDDDMGVVCERDHGDVSSGLIVSRASEMRNGGNLMGGATMTI